MHKKRKYILRFFITLLLLVPVTVFIMKWSVIAAGTTDDVITEVQLNYPEYFSTNNIIYDALRSLGWLLILLLRKIADFCITLYDHSLGFFSMVSVNINEYIPYAHELFTAILAVCILAMGVILIIHPKKKPDILVSLFLVVIAVSLQSAILIPLSTPTQSAVKELAQTNNYLNSLISNHVHDLFYIDNSLSGGLAALADGNIDIDSITAELTDSQIERLDATDVVNYANDRLSDAAKGENGIMGKRVVLFTNPDGTEEPTLVEIYNGFGWNDGESNDFFNEFFYRYKIDTMEIILALIATLIVYLMLSYKVIRIVIEIIVGNILAIFYSANFNGNQKVIQIFKEIINAFIVLLLSAVMVRIFLIGERTLSSMDLSGLEYGFLLLFLSFAIIDGPNVIQRIVGVDAGISNELGKLFAASQLMNMGAATIRMTAGAAGSIGRGIKAAGGRITGNAVNPADSSPNVPPNADTNSNPEDSDSSISDDSVDRNNEQGNIPPEHPNEPTASDTPSDHSTSGHDSSDYADIPPDQTDGTGMTSSPNIPPNDFDNTNSSDHTTEADSHNLENDPVHRNEMIGDIGRQEGSLDLSRDMQRSNYEVAADMNESIASQNKTPDINGISGIAQHSTTSMETNWDEFFENKEGDK